MPTLNGDRLRACRGTMATMFMVLMLLVASTAATQVFAAAATQVEKHMTAPSCGLTDIDQLRAEVRSTPTTPATFADRRSALGRWWRILWRQGYDLSAFSSLARQLSSKRINKDARGAPELIDEAYATLETIFIQGKRIPEVEGPAHPATQRPTQTNWPTHKSIDGSNSGYSPDRGPARGHIASKFPKGYHWEAKPVLVGDRIYLPSPGADVSGMCLDSATGETIWRARQDGFASYSTWGSSWDPFVTEHNVTFRIAYTGSDELVVNRFTGTPTKPRAESEKPQGATTANPIKRSWFASDGYRGLIKVWYGNTGAQAFHYRMQAESAGNPCVTGDYIFAADQTGKVYALDGTTSKLAWQIDLDTMLMGNLGSSRTEKGVPARVYLGSRDGRLFCMEAKDGRIRWTWTSPQVPANAQQVLSTPVHVGDNIYVGSANGSVYCLAESTGALLWSFDVGSWIRSSPIVIDDTVYVADLDGSVHALIDRGNRAEKLWQTEVNKHGFTADIEGNHEHILVGGRDLMLYALSPKTGALQWKRGILDGAWIDDKWVKAGTTKGLMTTPVIMDGVMYLGGRDGFVNAVDLDANRELWRYEIGGTASAAPCIGEGKVFIARQSRGGPKICALDLKTGQRIWERRDYGMIWVSAVYNDGLLFAGNMAGEVFAIQAATGEQVWSYWTGTDTPFKYEQRHQVMRAPGVYSNPALDDDTLYIGSWGGHYYALDQKTGELRWRTRTTNSKGEARPDSAAPVLHKNHLYVQKRGCIIAALNKTTGAIEWEWRAPPGFTQNGTIAAHGDMIYGSIVRDNKTLPYHATIFAFSDVENGGKELWKYDGGGGLTAPVITDGKLIFGSSADVFMTCLNPENGQLIWRTLVGQMLENVPAIYGDRVYAQSKNLWVVGIE